ncbi:ParB/RepB/Spo0J family partition protein [Sphingomonas nostoxanthinifaciens]|uniref:ParB/RepB/Spo0J family partition protein n=1 Tax=Sphingomonas nostoxanthinifaciens TaxID=2872652 RepID=UPI001CC202C3|nr:ParB/RepB/Spo0J family partition protein [Sphingomonas nostoxanthinifaciens]UAK24657.1 ParB/RepB/Spo0J family partition protein [Sphingomonas nostoxanthinifaciens]
MSEVKRGLGRGLSALLGEAAREHPIAGDASRTAGMMTLPVGQLVPNPDQPRRHFDPEALDELAASLSSRGLIQPIVVRPRKGSYEIVAGERRWRAAQRAGLHQVPVIVRQLDDAETIELAIVENVQRRDLNAIEEAQAYQRLSAEYGHTQEALARIVGKSRSHIANLLRLLELPEPVREAVAMGRLSMGHARALVSAPDPAALAQEAERRGLSVRETEALARGEKPARERTRSAPIEYKGSDADTAMLERQLGDQLGLKVGIAHSPKGGTLTISYATLDQLDMLCQRLSGEGF